MFVNIANNRKMERRGCSYGQLSGNINSNRHRQIGAATGEVAHRGMGEVGIVRSCTFRKRQWYIISREEIAHKWKKGMGEVAIVRRSIRRGTYRKRQ